MFWARCFKYSKSYCRLCIFSISWRSNVFHKPLFILVVNTTPYPSFLFSRWSLYNYSYFGPHSHARTVLFLSLHIYFPGSLEFLWVNVAVGHGFLFLPWDTRLTYLVNYDWLLLQVDTLQKNKLHSTNRTTGKSFPLWNIVHFVSTAKSCSNVVSAVKYCEKGNREIFELAHKFELRKTYLHFLEIRIIIIHQSFLACSALARVKCFARDDWHFDNKNPTLWLDRCSLKAGFDLTCKRTSALWGFEVSVATKYD